MATRPAYVWTGSDWDDIGDKRLGASVTALNTALGSKLDTSAYKAGMELITAQTITAQSDISVNGCFTSVYRNYQIVYDLEGSNPNPSFRLRASSTDETGSNYDHQIIQGDGAALNAVRTQAATSFPATGGAGRAFQYGFINIFRPQLALVTFYSSMVGASNANGASSVMTTVFGSHRLSNAYDGFTLSFTTATGTLRVYGLKD
jgi:hypothetical protein